MRSYQVWLHRLGTDSNSDVLIYEESDPTFSVSIGLSKSRKLVLVNINEEREIVPEEPGRHLSHFEAFETFVAVDVEDETGTSIRVFTIPCCGQTRGAPSSSASVVPMTCGSASQVAAQQWVVLLA